MRQAWYLTFECLLLSQRMSIEGYCVQGWADRINLSISQIVHARSWRMRPSRGTLLFPNGPTPPAPALQSALWPINAVKSYCSSQMT